MHSRTSIGCRPSFSIAFLQYERAPRAYNRGGTGSDCQGVESGQGGEEQKEKAQAGASKQAHHGRPQAKAPNKPRLTARVTAHGCSWSCQPGGVGSHGPELRLVHLLPCAAATLPDRRAGIHLAKNILQLPCNDGRRWHTTASRSGAMGIRGKKCPELASGERGSCGACGVIMMIMMMMMMIMMMIIIMARVRLRVALRVLCRLVPHRWRPRPSRRRPRPRTDRR